MRGCIPTGIEGLATRRPPPRGIKGRDYMLPRTRSLGSRVREEPSETPAISLCGLAISEARANPKMQKAGRIDPFRLRPYKLYGANGRVTGTSLTPPCRTTGPLGTMATKLDQGGRHKTGPLMRTKSLKAIEFLANVAERASSPGKITRGDETYRASGGANVWLVQIRAA